MDSAPYRMILAQRKQLGFLIRLEFCNHENGSCIALEDGDTHTRPQTNFFSVSCKWFRWAVLPLAGTPEAEAYWGGRDIRRFAVCGQAYIPKFNHAKCCPECAAIVHGQQKALSHR